MHPLPSGFDNETHKSRFKTVLQRDCLFDRQSTIVFHSNTDKFHTICLYGQRSINFPKKKICSFDPLWTENENCLWMFVLLHNAISIASLIVSAVPSSVYGAVFDTSYNGGVRNSVERTDD